MRHRYETPGIVLSRIHTGEATTIVVVLTPELGLVHARAQGLRKSGAKLAAGLATLSESSLVLVRGKEGWRAAGAVLEENWFGRLTPKAREIVIRVSGLLQRLIAGEEHDIRPYHIIRGLLETLATVPPELYETVEVLAVLHLLSALGLGEGVGVASGALFSPELLERVAKDRARFVARINAGITASGL